MTGHPVGKITKKQSEGVFSVNSALKIQCHVVKNTLLLRTAFSLDSELMLLPSYHSASRLL